MGFMEQTAGGAPELRGTVAYVPQTAFIYGGNVRENILFGQEFEQSRCEAPARPAPQHQHCSQSLC